MLKIKGFHKSKLRYFFAIKVAILNVYAFGLKKMLRLKSILSYYFSPINIGDCQKVFPARQF